MFERHDTPKKAKIQGAFEFPEAKKLPYFKSVELDVECVCLCVYVCAGARFLVHHFSRPQRVSLAERGY
jgi:hypothetical protein